MRFKLILNINRQAFGNLLPINYMYPMSAVVYHILGQADKQYATWLHNNGFTSSEGKKFKLFTFSRFKIEKRKIFPQSERIAILCDTIEWQISFLPEKSTEQFIQGLFANQTFEIADKKSKVQFHVRNIEVLPSPIFSEEMEFSSMSPICMRCKQEDGKIKYISPSDPKAKEAILTSLLSRYEAYNKKSFTGTNDFDFVTLNEPKSVLENIKADTKEETKVRGYMCQFKMKASIELMHIMYESGIGEECSQGFGCVRINKTK